MVFYNSLEPEASTVGVAWVERASKTGTLRDRPHWLWIYAEYSGTLTNRGVAVKVLVNGSEVAIDQHVPDESKGYRSFSTLVEINPPTSGSYTVSIEYRALHSSQTAWIRRVRLMVMQQ